MKLKMISYNIHKGFDLTGFKYTLNQIKSQLQGAEVDLILLQEIVGQMKKKNPIHPTEDQMEFMADQMWPHYAYGKNAIYSGGHHGNATLSKHSIVKHHNYNLTLHRLEQRGVLHCEIIFNHKKIHVLNTHLNLRASDRIKQLKLIKSYIDHTIAPEEALILGGDFNDWTLKGHDFISREMGLQECHENMNQNFAKTFPSLFPLLMLDRVYCRHIKPIQAQSLEPEHWGSLSDHLPLYVEFEI